MLSEFEEVIDALPDDTLVDALELFLASHELTGKFVLWLKEWKAQTLAYKEVTRDREWKPKLNATP